MSESQPIRPSIFLDYGADALDPAEADCEVCERGMRFCSPWQFTLGAVLHICFSMEEGGSCRIEAEGVVVECLATGSQAHLTTLAFVEPPAQLRDMLGEISTRLAFHPRAG